MLRKASSQINFQIEAFRELIGLAVTFRLPPSAVHLEQVNKSCARPFLVSLTVVRRRPSTGHRLSRLRLQCRWPQVPRRCRPSFPVWPRGFLFLAAPASFPCLHLFFVFPVFVRGLLAPLLQFSRAAFVRAMRVPFIRRRFSVMASVRACI